MTLLLVSSVDLGGKVSSNALAAHVCTNVEYWMISFFGVFTYFLMEAKCYKSRQNIEGNVTVFAGLDLIFGDWGAVVD